MSELTIRWHLFLTDQAIKFDLTPTEREVFACQYALRHEHSPNSKVVNSIETDLKMTPDNIKERSEGIFKKLRKSKEINFETDKGRRTDIVWQWLKQEYPKWEDRILGRSKLGVEAIWTQLKELGRYAPDRMGIYITENQIQTASALPKNYQPKPFLQVIPNDTEGLRFKIHSENMGQILLLNRDEENIVHCMCPSEFAPSINLNYREMSIPQAESDYASLGTEPGKEEWWAWIINNLPPLSWLESAKATALQLSAVQLVELLSQVELQKGEVLYTFYKVT
jgi:hypothetical protein